MIRQFSRRRFLASSIAASWVLTRPLAALGQGSVKDRKTLDTHVHLFGVGDGGSGCRLAKTRSQGPLFQLLLRKLRILERAKTLDEGYVLALAEHLEKSGLTKGAVLAQDAVYDRHGKPDWGRTPFYVPNDYLFDVVARIPERMIPCVSINPQRADAIDELQRCATKGAKVLKSHPPIQGVDISDKRFAPFFRRCADLEIVVMVHTGHEHSAPIISAALADPRKLALALDNRRIRSIPWATTYLSKTYLANSFS